VNSGNETSAELEGTHLRGCIPDALEEKEEEEEEEEEEEDEEEEEEEEEKLSQHNN